MAARPFVVADFPGVTSLAGEYTRRHPGSTTDTVLEDVVADASARGHFYHALGYIQGLDGATVDRFLAELRVRYGTRPRILGRSPDGPLLMRQSGRMTGAQGLAGMLRVAGDCVTDPWMHVEDGLHSIRSEVRDGRAPGGVADALAQALAAVGIACRVAVREVSGRDLLQWHGLKGALHELRRTRGGDVGTHLRPVLA